MTGHVTLLGDSILDNASYVPGGPSVIEHLRRMLPSGWKTTLLAQDGATVSATFAQVNRIPADSTHLVLSVGGNDALWLAGSIFATPTSDMREALQALAHACEGFGYDYRRLVNELRQLRQPLTICTIYDAAPGLDAAELAGLTVFNDCITRTAFKTRVALIDLRVVCDESSDYSAISPIEPSASGGGKIARAIISAVTGSEPTCRVIA